MPSVLNETERARTADGSCLNGLLNDIEKSPTGIFDNFYAEFLYAFGKRLNRMLLSINSEDFRIDIVRIMESALRSLKLELSMVCCKSLIAEMLEKKVTVEMSSKSNREKYDCVNNSFLDEKNVAILLKKYPVLDKLISKKIENKLSLIGECLTNLRNDAGVINNEFKMKIVKVDDIIFESGGDSHNGGKSVMIVRVNSGEYIVYKPHSLNADISFNLILNWINAKKTLKCELKNVSSINRCKYGWQKYIQYSDCKNAEKAKEYYYKLGALLAVFHIIKTNDIHYENIISSDGNAYVIDLETLFCNKNVIYGKLSDNILINTGKELNNSIYATLLIPQNLENSSLDIDLSAINGGNGGRSAKIKSMRIHNPGTDDIRFSSEYVAVEGKGNAVMLNGKNIVIGRYIHIIEEGFEDCYSTILKNKNEFRNLILSREFYGNYRQVMRATYVYYKFIDAAYHPNYLMSENDRKLLMTKIAGRGKHEFPRDRLIRAEAETLCENDIPYFFTKFDSRSLFYYKGGEVQEIEGFYNQELSKVIADNIDNISRDDLEKQRRFLHASFANVNGYDEDGAFRYKNMILDGVCTMPDKAAYLNAAEQIAFHIMSEAVWSDDKKSATAFTLNATGKHEYKYGVLNRTLYEGLGTVLFFLELAKVSGEQKYRIFYHALLKGILATTKAAQPLSFPSLFTGAGGLLYLYRQLCVLQNGDEANKRYNSIMEKLLSLEITEDTVADIINGCSGLIVLALNIFDKSHDQGAIDIADKYGHYLKDKLEKNLHEKNNTILTGFSHGCAGFSYALYMLGHFLNDKSFSNLALDYVRLENSNYNKSTENWKDLRTSELDADPVFWCHGAPGIALARVLSMKYCSKDSAGILKADAERAIKKLLKCGLNREMSDCLCHGICGNIDILLTISEASGNNELKQYVYTFASKYIKEVGKSGIKFPLPYNIESLNFMYGLSGIGYAMMRLYDPSIPSVLALETD